LTGIPAHIILPVCRRIILAADMEHFMGNLAKAGLTILATMAGIAASLAPAWSADYVRPTRSYHDEGSRICGEAGVLSRITGKFRYQVTHVPNLPPVDIVDFRNIHENRYLPAYADRPIARRYCGATAYTSDGRSHPIWYLIEEGAGFAGLGGNVEFCLLGFDRWHVYNGACRVLR
jgi:hypothetical protein